MKLVVYKRDIEYFLNNFLEIAEYDKHGKKHYFVFQDSARNGDWTLMRYENEPKWTIHGKGLDYCDDGEKELAGNELILFLFKNRKYINNELRRKNGVLTT